MARGKFQARRNPKRINWGGVLFIILTLIALSLAAALVLRGCDYQENPPVTTDTSTATPTTTDATTLATTSEPTTIPTTEPTEPYVVSTASLGVTGDVLLHIPVINASYQGNGVYDFSEIFTYIAPYYQAFDFMVANLEVNVAGADRGYSGYPTFNAPDSIVDALKDAGVDMLLTANNHTYDMGKSGFQRTQEVLNEKGMPHLGTRLDEDTPEFIIQSLNGIQVGMACYTYETGDTSDGRKTLNGIPVSSEDTNKVSSFNYKDLDNFYLEVEDTLAAMKAQGAEATVVYLHWGDEYQLKPNSKQEEIAQALCELGVDVIVGGHPHVIQPFETLTSSTGHQTYCIYSIGNAISNQRRTNISQAPDGHTEDSMIFSVVFEKWNDGSVKISEVNILPIWVNKEWRNSVGNIYRIIPLDTAVEVWDSYDVSSINYTYGSYKRTMKIVGEGLNACRETLGLPLMPMTANDD